MTSFIGGLPDNAVLEREGRRVSFWLERVRTRAKQMVERASLSFGIAATTPRRSARGPRRLPGADRSGY